MKCTTLLLAAALTMSASLAMANPEPYEQDGSEGGGGNPADVRTDSPDGGDVRTNEDLEQGRGMIEGLQSVLESLFDGVLNIVIAVPDHRSTL